MHVYLLPTWKDRITFVGEELRRHWKRVIVGTLVYIKVVSSVINTLSIIIGFVFDNNGRVKGLCRGKSYSRLGMSTSSRLILVVFLALTAVALGLFITE